MTFGAHPPGSVYLMANPDVLDPYIVYSRSRAGRSP